MKRFIAMLLCFLMIVSVVACGSEEPATATLDETAAETEAANENEENKTSVSVDAMPSVPTEDNAETDVPPTSADVPSSSDEVPVSTTKKIYNNPSVYVPKASTVPSFGLDKEADNSDFGNVTKPANGNATQYDEVDASSYPAVSDKLSASAVKIANDSMTTEELREIVVKFYELQLNFSWTPSTNANGYAKGSVQKGLPYQAGGTGNLYRVMEYYDEDTGIFYLNDAVSAKGESAIFADSVSALYWALSRVSNNVFFDELSEINVKNGFIPVGGYTYEYRDTARVLTLNDDSDTSRNINKVHNMLTIDKLGVITKANPGVLLTDADAKSGNFTPFGTKLIIDYVNNGSKSMALCYAEMLPGDVLVNGSRAVLVKSIDKNQSKVTILEQSNGKKEMTYTFTELQNNAFIPFTIAEFHKGEDAFWSQLSDSFASLNEFVALTGTKFSGVLETQKTARIEKAATYKSLATVDAATLKSASSSSDITITNLAKVTLTGNYNISDVTITVFDRHGNVKAIIPCGVATTTRKSVIGTAPTYAVILSELSDAWTDLLTPYKGGNYHIHVDAQLGNGEYKTAFEATLS